MAIRGLAFVFSVALLVSVLAHNTSVFLRPPRTTIDSQEENRRTRQRRLRQLEIHDLAPGEEHAPPARRGDLATITYVARLDDTTEVLSTHSTGPVTFEVLRGRFIEGLERSILGMRRGGRRMAKIPAELAYGEQGLAPVVPPNAALTYEIELVNLAPPAQGTHSRSPYLYEAFRP